MGGLEDRAPASLSDRHRCESGLSTYLLWTSYFVSECVFYFVKHVAQIGVVVLPQDPRDGDKTELTGLAGVEESESKWRRLDLGWVESGPQAA